MYSTAGSPAPTALEAGACYIDGLRLRLLLLSTSNKACAPIVEARCAMRQGPGEGIVSAGCGQGVDAPASRMYVCMWLGMEYAYAYVVAGQMGRGDTRDLLGVVRRRI
jgi:hypothetical protein